MRLLARSLVLLLMSAPWLELLLGTTGGGLLYFRTGGGKVAETVAIPPEKGDSPRELLLDSTHPTLYKGSVP